MTIKFSLATEKGGAGKTTSVASIAGVLSRRFQDGEISGRILIVDGDPAAGLTFDVCPDVKPKKYYADMIIDQCRENVIPNIFDAVVTTKFPGLDIIPSSNRLGIAADEIKDQEFGRERIITDIFSSLDTKYDYIIVDTMGAKHNMLTVSFLVYTEHAFCPTEPEIKNLKGLYDTNNLIQSIARSGANVDLSGVFVTKVDERRTASDMVILAQGDELFGDAFISTYIHQLTSVTRQAGEEKTPIEFVSPKSKIAQDYRDLTDEIIRRIGHGNQAKG